MVATMARQGGRVQLKQSDMRLVLNVGKMAKEGFSCSAMKETQFQIKNPHGEVREANKNGSEFPGNIHVKAAIKRHPAMLRQN
jgi:hypothetical protein